MIVKGLPEPDGFPLDLLGLLEVVLEPGDEALQPQGYAGMPPFVVRFTDRQRLLTACSPPGEVAQHRPGMGQHEKGPDLPELIARRPVLGESLTGQLHNPAWIIT